MKNILKKAIAFFLVIILIVPMCYSTVFAEGSEQKNTEQTVLEDIVTEPVKTEQIAETEDPEIKEESIPEGNLASVVEEVKEEMEEVLPEEEILLKKEEVQEIPIQQVFANNEEDKPTYVDGYTWNGSDVVRTQIDLRDKNLKPVPNSTTWDSGWYYLDRDLEIGDRVNVNGAVNLILNGNYTLTVRGGINVNDKYNSLSIYGSTGTLNAINDKYRDHAAIGGNGGARVGSIYIYGGNVIAKCLHEYSSYGAAIGSGKDGAFAGWEIGHVNIYHGYVSAYCQNVTNWGYLASDAVGIGGGVNSSVLNIRIYGGVVETHAEWAEGPAFSATGGELYINPKLKIRDKNGNLVSKPSGKTWEECLMSYNKVTIGKREKINNIDEFISFIKSIADGENYSECIVDLNCDIDLAGKKYTDIWPSSKSGHSFNGTFNGNGHTISNLNDTGSEYGGLFHILGINAEVNNLTLKNVNVSTTRDAGALASTASENVTITNVNVISGSISGKNSVGGLIGWLQKGANVSDCSNGASVSGGEHCGGIGGCLQNDSDDWQYIMKDCSNSGSISASKHAGGIAGNVDTDANHDFSSCKNTGKITSDGDCAGGIVGRSEGGGNYTNCTNSGAVSSKNCAGGIMGWNEDDSIDFSGSKNSGTINGTLDAGGIIGKFGGGNPFKFVGCVNSGSVTGGQTAGGIVGCVDNGGSHDFALCQNSGAITETKQSNPYAAGGLVGVNRGACHMTETKNTGVIRGGYSAGGLVGYVDTNSDQSFYGSVNEGNVTADANCAGGITGQSYGGGNYSHCTNKGKIIGKFAGGMVGWNDDDAIDFSDSTNSGDIDATRNSGDGHGGGIAGYLGNEKQDPGYTGLRCTNTGNVTATDCAGGIVGRLQSDGTHDFCECYNSGTIYGKNNSAGGIIGANWGNIIYLKYCTNKGNVKAPKNAGGIIGWDENGLVVCSCSTNTGTISGTGNKGQIFAHSGGTVNTSGCVEGGSVASTLSSFKNEIKNYKDEPVNYTTERKCAVLDAYEIVAQNPKIKAELEADKELQAWIQKMKEDVKAAKQRVTSDGLCVSLNTVNGSEPDWRYVLSADTISTPEEVKAKLDKDWKVLDARDITVLKIERLAMEEKPTEGKFTFGFSGKDFAKYKNYEAIVYHVTENGIEKLKPVWNEENQCFEVTANTCSSFVFAVNTKDAPQTGDENIPGFFIVLGIIALIAMAGCAVLLKKSIITKT